MPLYEFRCPDGHDFEKFYRSIGSAAAEEKCPVCAKVAVRLMSTAGLVFKGSGFYITDYGKDGKKAEREAASLAATTDKKKTEKESASPDSSTKSDTASAESKPAAAESTAKPAIDSSAKPVTTTTESKPAKPATPKAKPTRTA